MIHLDTNVLIALSDPTSAAFHAVEGFLKEGRKAAASVVAWHEYVRGPILPEDRKRTLWVLESRVFELTRAVAELAAHLFNETGRRRASTADCLIAAAAIHADDELLTANYDDFVRFVPLGLALHRC